MQIVNTQERYGAIAQALHWGVAVFIIGAYLAMIYHEEFTVKDTSAHLTSVHIHFSLGISAGCLILLRVIARLSMAQPRPIDLNPIRHKVSVIIHVLLYFCMVAMPITGYLGTGADTNFFGLLEITQFRETGLWLWLENQFGWDWKAMEDVVDEVHHFIGGSVFWVLIVLHIGAAIYHQHVLKDNIMARMKPAEGAVSSD